MKVSVFVPAHITGFFSIHENIDPLKKGSCGAGILIDKGVVTTIKTKPKNSNDKKNSENHEKENHVNITINGKNDPKNETISHKTIGLMNETLPLGLNYDISINHDIQVPIGAGFGTSASCGLGTAIGLSKLLKLPLSTTEAAKFAHIAEVNLGSGLGDVLSQTSKGIVIRKFPGAPGIGKVENISKTENNNQNYDNNDNNYNNDIIKDKPFSDTYVLTKTFGEIDTSSVIKNPFYVKKINEIGMALEKKIIAEPTIENFMKCSYEFSKKTNLMNEELQNLIEELNKKTMGASMAMLGNTIFTIVKKENIDNIEDLSQFTISQIYNDGIKVI